MRRKDLVSKVAAQLKESGYRKSVKVPRHTFRISDEYGNSRNFTVQQEDKMVALNNDDIEQVLQCLVDAICESLRCGEEVNIYGFGKFYLRWIQPRKLPDVGHGSADYEGGYMPRFRCGDHLISSARLYYESLKDSLVETSELQYDEEDDESLCTDEQEEN